MKNAICAVGSLLLALSCYVFAQDLGALAQKERERRKEQAKAHPTPARVVTDEDMSSAAQRRAIDAGEKPGATSAPPLMPPDPSAAVDAAAEKLREALEEDRQERLAARLRSELRMADDAVRSAEAALQRAKDRHDKVPMITSGESPFAARHRAEAYVTEAEKALEAAKQRVRAIEDEAYQAGLDPTRLH